MSGSPGLLPSVQTIFSISTITQSAYTPPPTTQIVTRTVSQPAVSTPFPSSPENSFYGTRTILGPLTTIFTPPEACATPFFANNGQSVFYGIDCPPESIANAATSCFPSQFVNSAGVLGNLSSSALQVYSPAVGCPQSWTSACGASRIDYTRALGDQYLTNWMNVGEVMQVCCPSGWQCSLPLGPPPTPAVGDNPLMQCTISFVTNVLVGGYNCSGGQSTTSIEFISAGITPFQGAPGIALLTGASSASNAANTASAQTPSPSQSHSNGANSATIGIGVGVSLGTVIIASLILVIWLKCFRRRRDRGFFNSREYKHELEANSKGKRQQTPVAELEAMPAIELDGTSKPVEVEGIPSPTKFDEPRDRVQTFELKS